MRTIALPSNCEVALVNGPVPLNIFVSSAITITPVLPKNDCVEAVLVRPSSIIEVLVGNVALVRPDEVNALNPMLVTEDGKVTDVIPVAPWNAFAPMLVTEDGMVTDVRPVMPWKALTPMLVTEDGMVTDVSPLIPWKALAPMLVAEDGMVIDVTPEAS